ncbi:LOW QUALITY PROTEIN: rano class II histocompatibility antigen, A beta chain [Onychostoma macrolepis]|uniref:LOW QUALITY PROTEIN: rano class II histocompatibility antigen, A beta chain n=1 Tax=Onychostoma macrolepis TaxID=369639 RepID=UPI00272CC170|nr:LOW QUALITY PROTEIN: rano class II histocompatibility antigen, A beta chain [Onychostoma macrolepis]
MLLCPDCNAKMQYNLVVVFLSALFETVHGLYGYVQIQCRVPDSQQNIEFIFSVTCNMIEYLRYNSTEDKAIGKTEFGKKLAEDYNKNKILLAQTEFALNQCKIINYFAVQPEVIIRLEYVNQKAMLVCSAYDFYPKPIKLTWMRNDKEMAADVTSIEEMANGDCYYQIYSHLEYFPKRGGKISSCHVVEHASSHKPMIYYWECLPSLEDFDRNKLITGVVIADVGLICYKKKKAHSLELELQVIFVAVQTVGNTERLLDSCVRIQKPPPSEVPPSSVLAREPRAVQGFRYAN